MIKNEEHKDYVRFGCNRNGGSARQEMIIVDKDGTVDIDVPVTFDYEKITDVIVIDAEDTPITIEGGRFRNICCRACADTDFKNRYVSYQRNIRIQRSNVTIKNLDHKMVDEPEITGLQNESYPYGGFIYIVSTNNVKLLDCDLTGHKTYYEDRSHIANNSAVPMGTYDLVVHNSTHIQFENVTQSQVPVDSFDYWGIMGSSYCKCFTFINCKLSRFDAHCGFWNTKLINCVFGSSINVIGGGELYIENTTRIKGRAFIELRGDYGATFNGKITLKNCTHIGSRMDDDESQKEDKYDPIYLIYAAVTNGTDVLDDSQNYYEWDFGYTCYLPQFVHVENSKCDAEHAYVFTDVRDEHFSKKDKRKEYQLTKKVVLKDCDNKLQICANKDGHYNYLAAVPMEKE